ncbi:polysaccharide pyruvyl transferase family protein [Rhodococcoides yunnanense]|uniref:polysaccharide pyruvyl transferase family protein n=1 Tax=Rhodococcoides yunnanense TaxID=278209 RepID=UPI000A03F747|nr:polysaccharide pyruvyl transferase family protein [Rhodococcus yunnanensis]
MATTVKTLLRTALRRARQFLDESYGSARVSSVLEHLWRDNRPFTGTPKPTRHLLLPPPGRGNIGDQAMVEAFLENVEGDVVVIVKASDSFVFDANDSSRLTIVAMPNLIYGRWFRQLIDLRKFHKIADTCTSYSVIGADIMDGAYNELASINRYRTLSVAIRAGLDSRILGFSWNSEPTSRARAAMIECGHSGVKILARDPVSYNRLESLGVENLSLVADTVFADSRVMVSDRVLNILDRIPFGKSFALVNASGLVGRSGSQVQAYSRLISSLQSRDLFVVLLPHVIRPGGSDLVECRSIQAALRIEDLYLVSELLRPSEVRQLADRCHLVVSGRMHLSVIALSVDTPAITVATQGKVEGLAQMFKIQDLTVSSEGDLESGLEHALQTFFSAEPSIRAEIADNGSRARLLAYKNFPGRAPQSSDARLDRANGG